MADCRKSFVVDPKRAVMCGEGARNFTGALAACCGDVWLIRDELLKPENQSYVDLPLIGGVVY